MGQNGLISSLLIHENYIFFVEEDKYVRSNRSNIEFPFIIALECVRFDLKATRLKLTSVCDNKSRSTFTILPHFNTSYDHKCNLLFRFRSSQVNTIDFYVLFF